MRCFLIFILLFNMGLNITSLENEDSIKIFFDSFKEKLLDNNKTIKELENYFKYSDLNQDTIFKLAERKYFEYDYKIKEILQDNNDENIYNIKAYVVQKYYSKSGVLFKLKTNKFFRIMNDNGKFVILYTDLTKGLSIVILLIIILLSIAITIIPIVIIFRFLKKKVNISLMNKINMK